MDVITVCDSLDFSKGSPQKAIMLGNTFHRVEPPLPSMGDSGATPLPCNQPCSGASTLTTSVARDRSQGSRTRASCLQLGKRLGSDSDCHALTRDQSAEFRFGGHCGYRDLDISALTFWHLGHFGFGRLDTRDIWAPDFWAKTLYTGIGSPDRSVQPRNTLM